MISQKATYKMNIFIPIKEKSQRVPNKNFRMFGNVALYERTLNKLKDHSVYVDTDSEFLINQIKENKNLNHVTVYKRDEKLLGHKTSVCSLIKHAIEINNLTGTLCQIHVTSPFLKVSTIENAVKFMKIDYDSVVSCNKYQNRLWRKEKYGYCPINHNPLRLEQTQDLPTYFEENSLFYMFRVENFLKTNSRIGSNPYFYKCNFPENIDIDTESDWSLSVHVNLLEAKIK